MIIYAIPLGAYHRRMSDDGLPRPAAFLSLAEIAEQLDHVRAVLAQGGAVVVVGDDRAEVIGVLTWPWTTAASCRSGPCLKRRLTVVAHGHPIAGGRFSLSVRRGAQATPGRRAEPTHVPNQTKGE
jgi:hypothetical protein